MLISFELISKLKISIDFLLINSRGEVVVMTRENDFLLKKTDPDGKQSSDILFERNCHKARGKSKGRSTCCFNKTTLWTWSIFISNEEAFDQKQRSKSCLLTNRFEFFFHECEFYWVCRAWKRPQLVFCRDRRASNSRPTI